MKQVDLVYQLFLNSIVALIPTAIILKGKKKKNQISGFIPAGLTLHLRVSSVPAAEPVTQPHL